MMYSPLQAMRFRKQFGHYFQRYIVSHKNLSSLFFVHANALKVLSAQGFWFMSSNNLIKHDMEGPKSSVISYMPAEML